MIKLDPHEELILTVRRHWFIFVIEVAFFAFLAVIPLVLFSDIIPVDITLSSLVDLEISERSFYLFLYATWLLILWIGLMVEWTDWYLDAWFVTNKRIIDVEQMGLFNRKISIMHLEDIQDVTTHVRGVIGTLMKFGEIHVQTAGAQREFVFTTVAQPIHVKEEIIRARDAKKR